MLKFRNISLCDREAYLKMASDFYASDAVLIHVGEDHFTKTFDELMKNLFDDYNLSLSIQQYALVGSSVKSYLSYLLDNEKITCFAEDNRLVWQAV